ncbi:MAG: DUF983 domain-containing protein [Hyphomonas sp.]|uniref:DUF983 domain-containing protein n=1 Tax=Hyphomonas sp. TaxID=87 RepID=UPI00352942D5
MPEKSGGLAKPDLKTALWRAVRMKCPQCGRGAIYRAYLKPVETCSACGAPIGEIRADDGPAWLTVLMLGPFLVAVTFGVSMSGLPLWATLPTAAIAVTAGVLAMLPLVKSAFIAALWVAGGNRQATD